MTLLLFYMSSFLCVLVFESALGGDDRGVTDRIGASHLGLHRHVAVARLFASCFDGPLLNPTYQGYVGCAVACFCSFPTQDFWGLFVDAVFA